MSLNNEKSLSQSRGVTNLRGKVKNSFLVAYPHCIVPGHNFNDNVNIENFDEDHLMSLFRQFPYDCDSPKPLLPPAKVPVCVLKNEDPALQLLTVKTKMKEDINRITDYYKKHTRDGKKPGKISTAKQDSKKSNDTEITTLPRYVAELAAIIQSDSHPHFEGEYNWLYTGGTLNSLKIADKNVLVFPYANELVATEIAEQSETLWKPNLERAAKVDLRSTIYEIKSTNANRTCRVLSRLKNYCNVSTLSVSRGKLKLDDIHEQFSEIPYVSADLNPVEQTRYCTATASRLLELWDFNRVTCLSSKLISGPEDSVDNWFSIRFHQADPNLITFVDRCCLHYIDLRTPFDTSCLVLCPKNNLEICESISLNIASKHNAWYQYLATSHSLLLSDVRFEKPSVVQKWTNQFRSAPIFGDVINRADEEIITLASQLSREHSITINTWTNETNMHSYCLPYVPPSVSETLRACQVSGKCLDPSLRSRVELCNVGTALTMHGSGNIFYFIQNSIGDIFYQGITHEKSAGVSEMNNVSASVLSVWEEAFVKQGKTVIPVLVSEKMNMQHVLNGIRDPDLQLNYAEPATKEIEPRWFQSIEQLSSYEDILAPELLSAWDVKPDSSSMAVTPLQKVLSWLEKKEPESNLTQSQEETSILNESNEIFSQDLISVSQIHASQFSADDTLNREEKVIGGSISHRQESARKKKKTVKMNKYIAGF